MISSSINRVQQIYDARSEIPFDGQTYLASVKNDIDMLIAAGVAPNSFICDVGCGLGWHLDEMHRHGFRHLYGIDVSAQTLQQFERRSRAVRLGRINLVWGDVRKWNVLKFFHVVTAYLSCLGEFSKSGDLAFLKALARITRPDGIVVFSFLSAEEAEMIKGTSLVKYSASRKETVANDVRLDESGKWLTICQTLSSGKQIPDERIYLYSAAEIETLATDAGLKIEAISHPNSHRSRSSRVTVLARPE